MNLKKDNTYFWDKIFAKKQPINDIESIELHKDLKNNIVNNLKCSKYILDYGCDSGTMFLKCACFENVKRCNRGEFFE